MIRTFIRYERQAWCPTNGQFYPPVHSAWHRQSSMLFTHQDLREALIARPGLWHEIPEAYVAHMQLPRPPQGCRWVHRIAETWEREDGEPPPDEVCQHCHDQGGCGMTSQGWYEVGECECCYKVAPQKIADDLNARERLRQTGWHADRIQWNDHERAYATVWADENRARRGFNHGMSIVQALLFREGTKRDPSIPWFQDIPDDQRATERDYRLCATLIQWLGTNIGRAFLDDVQRKLKSIQDERVSNPFPWEKPK